MKILITGGTGFIGKKLVNYFLLKKHEIIVLSRKNYIYPNIRVINNLNEIDYNEKIDVIINLAGAPINKRWNNNYKNILIKSRTEITNNIIYLIKSLKIKPLILISASAIGYYGSSNISILDENSDYINDFTHQLCNSWENEAKKALNYGVRTCIARLGIVLGKDGGALNEILPIFKLGAGGKLGTGKQFFSWIHCNDVIGAFDFFINNKNQRGIYNLTSPNPVTNLTFTKILGNIINRPVIFYIPSFLIKLAFGEMGQKLLLNGPCVYPTKLLNEGYKFEFQDIKDALKNIINK